MPVLTRSEKIAKNKRGKRIESLYYARCNRVQIPILQIPVIFRQAEQAIALNPQITDQELGDKIAAYVETIRSN